DESIQQAVEERAPGSQQFDFEMQWRWVGRVSDAARTERADQESGRFRQRCACGGKSDALHIAAGKRGEPLQAEGQISPTLIAGQRMDFIDYDSAQRCTQRSRARLTEENRQTFRRGEKDFRRLLRKSTTKTGWGVPRAQANANSTRC